MFKEKDYVSFEYSGIAGTGWIRGKATTGLAVIGAFYIVEIDGSNLNPDIYPYTCISIPEIAIQLL